MDIRIGKQLTQAREALGLIVEDVAHRTRIPPAIVRQLESEDFSQFPSNVYAKSFLRLYSRHLGVDPAPYISEHDGQLKHRDDEVAFLDGIALSPEFKPEEAMVATSPAAVAAVEATKMAAPAGKISSGFMTVLLLGVVGIPTAFLLSKLYDQGDEPGTAPPSGEIADGKPTPPPPTETPDPDPEATPEPAIAAGGEARPALPVEAVAGLPEGEGDAAESTTLNPPVETPEVLPAVSIDAPVGRPDPSTATDGTETVVPRAIPAEIEPTARTGAVPTAGRPLAAADE